MGLTLKQAASLQTMLTLYFLHFQLEAAAAIPKSEPAPELEKKVRSMAMEKLHMEKLIAKLYSVSQ